jgi:hypothetical protein
MRVAKAEHRPLSQLIRELLREYVAEVNTSPDDDPLEVEQEDARQATSPGTDTP